MNKILFYTLLLLLASCTSLFAQDDLDKYIARLRQSAKEGGKETAFMSPGAEFIYGQDYFEAKDYFFAASSFKRVVDAQKDNAFANYQLAVSLLRQKDKYKEQEAQQYLEAAFRLNPSLQERYAKDVPVAKAGAANSGAKKLEGLDVYIEKLKYSRAIGGKETAMSTAGNSAIYGIDYFERGEYESAATNFRMSLGLDADNPYVKYLLAVCLHALQNKDSEIYLAQAFEKDETLKERSKSDLATAAKKQAAYEASRKYKYQPAEKEVFGGKLITGTYTCYQVVFNGSRYDRIQKGYFVLSANKTYRWLDNGGTGKYRYDPATGSITWLSGSLKDKRPVKTQFQPRGQITIEFSADYRWECGCNTR